jgi:hypothetical protein
LRGQDLLKTLQLQCGYEVVAGEYYRHYLCFDFTRFIKNVGCSVMAC